LSQKSEKHVLKSSRERYDSSRMNDDAVRPRALLSHTDALGIYIGGPPSLERKSTSCCAVLSRQWTEDRVDGDVAVPRIKRAVVVQERTG
jgi:hypothetical protein